MYTGNNPTAITSQKMIVDALNKLLKEKNFKDITIRELCYNSGISRQTFYSLFGTKENIILYQLEQSADNQRLSCKNIPQMTLMDTCKVYSEFVITNYELLNMLIKNELTSVLNKQFSKALYGCDQSFVNVNICEKEYVSQFMSAGLCKLTCSYVEKHQIPDREELTNLAYKIMSGKVYRL